MNDHGICKYLYWKYNINTEKATNEEGKIKGGYESMRGKKMGLRG